MLIMFREVVLIDEFCVQEFFVVLSIVVGMGEILEVGLIFVFLLMQECGCVVVVEEDGRIFGMVSVSYNLVLCCGEYCQFEEFIVDLEVCGKNVGGLFVQKLIDDVRV